MPLEGYEPGGEFEDGMITQLVDAPTEDILIARVPPTCSTAMAQDIEQQLTAKLKRPVIVMTTNIELCRCEDVPREEVIEALKGVNNNAVPEEALTQGDPEPAPGPSLILGPDGLPADPDAG